MEKPKEKSNGKRLCSKQRRYCPITSQEKGYPFEVKISGKAINGVVLSDQVKSFDWKIRKAKFVAKAKDAEIAEVIGKIKTLIN